MFFWLTFNDRPVSYQNIFTNHQLKSLHKVILLVFIKIKEFLINDKSF